MVWPFSRKKQRRAHTAKSPFKSGAAFFEYICEFGGSTVRTKQGMIALVLDAKKEFGVSKSVHIEPDGRQLAMLKVAADDGGFVVPAYTQTSKGDRLKPDDIVVWTPLKNPKTAIGKAGEVDPRPGSVGFIVAKVAPEIDTTSSELKTISRYD